MKREEIKILCIFRRYSCLFWSLVFFYGCSLALSIVPSLACSLAFLPCFVYCFFPWFLACLFSFYLRSRISSGTPSGAFPRDVHCLIDSREVSIAVYKRHNIIIRMHHISDRNHIKMSKVHALDHFYTQREKLYPHCNNIIFRCFNAEHLYARRCL